MRVIITKDCKDGKVNEVIDVSAGYATNFLIKKGFAVPVNSKTTGKLNRDIKHALDDENKHFADAERAKTIIEKTTLHFSLAQTNDVIHGSITRKQIHNKLEEKKIHIRSVNIENKKIASFGVSQIKIKLYKTVIATLKVEVKPNE